jgi:hypothetical protein
MKKYFVSRINNSSTFSFEDASIWKDVAKADIDSFRPESSDHHPGTSLKLIHDTKSLYGMFDVRDKFVRAIHSNFNEQVAQDSCVELFVKHKDTPGYFNFEFNCGGNILAYYITDHTRIKGGFKQFVKLDPADLQKITVYHTMPSITDPEIAEPTHWKLGFIIPVSIMEKYCGLIGDLSGQHWTGNFYKCGDKTSHPHWASWSPVNELNFHLPRCFGSIIFQ